MIKESLEQQSRKTKHKEELKREKKPKKTEVDGPPFDEVDQASIDSFPASDPPGWWR